VKGNSPDNGVRICLRDKPVQKTDTADWDYTAGEGIGGKIAGPECRTQKIKYLVYVV
jgi:hypothetical protein